MQEREVQAGQSYECFPDIPFELVMADLFRAKGIQENADALGINAAQLFRISSIEYLRMYPGAGIPGHYEHEGCDWAELARLIIDLNEGT